MTDKQLLEQALEALESAQGYIEAEHDDRKSLYEPYGMDYKYSTEAEDLHKNKEAITAIRARLEQPEQEPTIEDNSQDWAGMDGATAWHLIHRHADGWADVGKMMDEWREANTTPPTAQRQWIGLTDEDRQAAFESMPDMLEGFLKKWGWLHFSKAIEAKLKEKNT